MKEAGERFVVRPYRPEDLAAIYEVCLRTGDSGEDATHLYDDPLVLGHLYAGPYVTLEPELAFVLADDAGVCGYVLGALDTRAFKRDFVERWLPPLQASLPDPKGDPESWSRTERLYHRLHHPEPIFPSFLDDYPSHLHIDLLPRAQGRGFGRRLMETLFAELSARGSAGVHLGVGMANRRARRFYERLDFTEVSRFGSGSTGGLHLARRLPPPARLVGR